MLASPEVSRMLAAYEAMFDNIVTLIHSRHHEANVVAQTYFFQNM